MCERLLSKVISLKHKDDDDFRSAFLAWLKNPSSQDETDFSVTKSDFAEYFINFIRSRTERFLNVEEDSEILSSTKEQTSSISDVKRISLNRSPQCSSDKITALTGDSMVVDEPSVASNRNIEIKNSESESSLEIFTTNENVSTPKRNISLNDNISFSPVTPIGKNISNDPNNSSRFSTPNMSRTSFKATPNNKVNRSFTKDRPANQYSTPMKSNQRGVCIGDFMVPNETNLNRKKKGRFLNLSLDDPLLNSNKENTKIGDFHAGNMANLNIADKDMFPDIGSNRNQTRRIKPTRLNMTFPTNSSVSLGVNFGIKYDKVEQNEAFKMQNCQISEHSSDFKLERDILKREKINLIEKFNQMNNSSVKKSSTSFTPINQISIKRNSPKNISTYVFDMQKVFDVNTLELLSSIYSMIIDTNIVPNILSELHYIISLAMIHHINISEKEGRENPETTSSETDDLIRLNEIFDCVDNCIYFALGCLDKQKSLLNTILDKNSLRLLIQNDRIKSFSIEFSEHLNCMYCEKRLMDEKVLKNTSSDNFTNRNVYFITDTDSADNFPSYQNFIVFKSQRDGFYETLRFWEEHHQSADWSFERKLGPKIRSLVSMSSSPSNFAHLARLFKSQLLIACTAQEKIETLSELQSVIGNNGVCQNKLNKLAERLTGALPGQHAKIGKNNLTSPPDFSGCEEFFRDFIVHSNNGNFREHLIDSFVQEINKLDETGFVPSDSEISGNFIDEEGKAQYILCMKSLRVLAKFLGFLMSLPYRSAEKLSSPIMPGVSKLDDNKKNDNADNARSNIILSEIATRNLILPPINLVVILHNSYRKHKLILTIPWMVQLLAMLDYSYLRLLYFKRLHEMLFGIFNSSLCRPNSEPKAGEVMQNFSHDSNVDDMKQIHCYNELVLPHNSKCLIRICLGWLFDLQHFPRDSFQIFLKSVNSRNKKSDDHGGHVLKNLVGFINNSKLRLTEKNVEENQCFENETETNGDLNDDDIKKLYNLSLEAKEEELEFNLDSLEIVDDNVIKEICPFLKDFRFLFAKTQSSNSERERGIRHITPVTSSFNSDKQKRKDKELQMRLEEWFLRSQPGTTRRTIELVSERTGAALVRLAKSQISDYSDRAHAATQSLMTNCDENSVRKIAEIFNRYLLDFHTGCKKAGKHIAEKRVRGALQGLLPPLTHPSILETCVQICTRNALRKFTFCLESQYNNISVLFNNNSQVKKLLSNVDNDYLNVQRTIMMHRQNEINMKSTSELDQIKPACYKTFDEVYHSPTLLIIELKDKIINIINGENVEQCAEGVFVLMKKIKKCCDYSYIDKYIKNVLLQLSLDLTIHFICFNPSVIDMIYLNNVGEIWKKCTQTSNNDNTTEQTSDILDGEIDLFRKYMGTDEECRSPKSPKSPRRNDADVKVDSSTDDVHDVQNQYFDTLLCTRNIKLLRDYWIAKNEMKWKALEMFFVYILENKFVSEESLTDQIVAVYRQDHSQEFLENIAKCIKGMVEKCKLHSNEKLTLILEFISDFCHDLDNDYFIENV